MLRGLTEERVEFVVVGGVAAVALGAPIATQDLDICYDSSGPNVGRLVALLRRWKAYPREWEAGLPFDLDVRTFRTTPLLTLQTTEGWLDLLDRVEGVGGYSKAREAAVEIEAFEVRFHVLGIGPLIDAKRAAGRSRDLQHLPMLEALRSRMTEREGSG